MTVVLLCPLLCVCLICRADEVTIETVQAEYDTGKSFVYDQLDVFNRPVLIITASKHNVGEHGQGQDLWAGCLTTCRQEWHVHGKQWLTRGACFLA